MMNRAFITILLFLLLIKGKGQMTTADVVVKNYSTAQKRLLIISTIHFINYVATNLDQDSVTLIACRITGMPLLLAYHEGFEGKVPDGEALINAGRISDARQLLQRLGGEQRTEMLLDLSIGYLHRAGAAKIDLDSAESYLNAAANLLNPGKFSSLLREWMFLRAALYRKKGNDPAGNALLTQIEDSATQAGDAITLARVWQMQGELLGLNDPVKLEYYYKALDVYHQHNLKEKEIELLEDIAAYHYRSDPKSLEDEISRIRTLQKATGFRHSLYTENIHAVALVQQNKYIDALAAINAALENMRWSGIDAVAGCIYMRMGTILGSLGKDEDCYSWYRKALNVRKNDTHLFWYKSIFFLTTDLVMYSNKPGEALVLLDSITKEYPPLTVWEKLQVLSIRGYCYQQLHKPLEADLYYMQMFDLAKNNPQADPYGELVETYITIAQFYAGERTLVKARRFLELAKTGDRKLNYQNALKYAVLFSIDSMEGNYRQALQDHILHKSYFDLCSAADQRQQMDALTVKSAAEKKDKDIQLLKDQALVDRARIDQNRLAGNILIAGAALVLVIIGMLLSQFRLKQRANNEMNRKNATLQRLAEEKGWLLNEVNHRVKKNLHTIICLLESQAEYLENDALKAIENSRHRIYAMSLIHQKLNHSENEGFIDMSVYLPEFVRYLDDSFGTHEHVSYQLDIDPVKLGVPQAMPLALIINEAVTNSIKYAFPEQAKGTITISLRVTAGEVSLFIADNGIGFDHSTSDAGSGSLGMKLMRGLSEDINAEIEFKNEDGAVIRIIFRVNPTSEGPFIVSEINEKNIHA